MDYDLTIIGAGWAGFNAALKAKELGLRVCLIEKSEVGGTCLNRGCIPTKSLIQSAKVFSLIKKAKNFGIEAGEPVLSFSKVQERKELIIRQLRQGMQFMLKGIDLCNSYAQIISDNEIKLQDRVIKTKYILIASGSKPIELTGLEFDGKKIISSDDILNLKEIPPSLLIVGGGVIGCEFASLFNSLGSQVTMVEKMPQLLPGEDKELAKKIENTFKKKGIKVYTETDAAALESADYSLTLVCVGRVPVCEGLGLENIGVKTERGRIIIDEYLRTNIPNIYAAGDVTGKIMLAHFAAYQGSIAAENIVTNNSKKADNTNIPNCIFTDPEIASIGLSEDKAKSMGIDVVINRFDFLGSGMARILDEAEGFIKVVSDKKTEEILGSAIIGPKATELIAIFSLAVSVRLKVNQIKETVFAHPTLSESIHEVFK